MQKKSLVKSLNQTLLNLILSIKYIHFTITNNAEEHKCRHQPNNRSYMRWVRRNNLYRRTRYQKSIRITYRNRTTILRPHTCLCMYQMWTRQQRVPTKAGQGPGIASTGAYKVKYTIKNEESKCLLFFYLFINMEFLSNIKSRQLSFV